MVFVRNPDWFDSPRPYLDRVTIRVVPELQQQRDTFTTGDADGLWTTEPTAIDSMAEAIDGAHDVTVFAGGTPAYAFNTTAPPFDDLRVRQAVVMAVDREFLAEMTDEAAPSTNNFSVEGTPWYSEEAELPDYDPEVAQELIDDVIAEQGRPVEIEVGGFTGGTADQARVEFIQTSLNEMVFGWILRPEIHDAQIYGDGILRSDLLWRSG